MYQTSHRCTGRPVDSCDTPHLMHSSLTQDIASQAKSCPIHIAQLAHTQFPGHVTFSFSSFFVCSPREGLTVTGGWSCGRCTLRGVLVKTVCGSWWCVGETTISLSALVEEQHNLHRHHVLTVSVPCTRRQFGSSAGVSSFCR